MALHEEAFDEEAFESWEDFEFEDDADDLEIEDDVSFADDDFDEAFDEEFSETDEDEEEFDLLPGFSQEEIREALDEEFGVKTSGDASREELAEKLIELRTERVEGGSPNEPADEEIEETLQEGEMDVNPETGEVIEEDETADVSPDDDLDGVDLDFLEAQGMESSDPDLPDELQGEEREIDVSALEESDDPNEISASLETALKQEDISTELNVEQAVRLLGKMESDVIHHKNKVMMLRWRQGLIAEATPVRYGEGTMSKLEKATGVAKNTLREAKRLVNEFGFDRKRYVQWLKDGDNGTRTWTEVLALIRDDVEPDDDGDDAQEEFRDRLINKAERLAFYLEKVNNMIENAEDEDEDTQREIEGITQVAMAEIRRFMKSRFYHTGEFTDEKRRIPRSDEYLDFIRSFPSIVNGNPNTEAHHTDTGGTGTKGSDFSCLPLTREQHNELHSMGQDRFEEKYSLDLDALKKQFMHRFLTGEWMEGERPNEIDPAE